MFIVRTAGIYFMPVLSQNIGYISIGFDYVVQLVVFLIFWRLRSCQKSDLCYCGGM